jgi:CheY-like chemotaxis protein
MSTKILYVEDNPQNMRLIRKYLSTVGYDLLEAVDGSIGIEMAIREQPDLILMDIGLPDIDGVSATECLKSLPNLSAIPIIALTADAFYYDREQMMRLGCDGYLAKPITRNELIQTIAQFLNTVPSA